MYISQIGRNTVIACAFCDILISNKLKNPEALHKLCEQLKEHLDQNMACRVYKDLIL